MGYNRHKYMGVFRVFACFLSGVALSLAFPRANQHWLAWIALSPLMYFACNSKLRVSLVCGFAFGFGFFASHLYWILIFGKLPWALLAIFQSLFVLLWAVLANILGRPLGEWGRLFLLPALWVCTEWFRSIGMMGFTWGDIGYSQHSFLPFIQIAAITGVWGVSFLVALVNSWLANVKLLRAQAVIVAVVLAAVLAYGAIILQTGETSSKKLRAAAVQGNIDQDVPQDYLYIERTLRTYRELTRQVSREGARLIVWPETAVPGNPATDYYLQAFLSTLAADSNTYLLVGAHNEDEDGKCFNCGFLIAPGRGIVGKYAKVHLVPFGEFVPARKYLPFLSYYRVTPVDLSPGPGFNILTGGPHKLGLAICFESIFPEISRKLVSAGAEVLCVITNDAWFKQTAAAEQHAVKSVFRAIENRRYLIRAASTGVSCIIDPRGRILAKKGIFEPGAIIADVNPIDKKTFYTRMGDWFVYFCFGITIVFGFFVLFRSYPKLKSKE
ncbi:MAG: apolipoprotein N-acyltransferase [Armatimonadetes bacterium]|nr:apolipoprotein N-acyltransferase [Armatimonadota bacterium]